MSDSAPLSRHRIPSEETRRRLCEAATEVLADGGLGEFSFVRVCDRAGLSRGAIHHHYDSPADLLADVVAHIYDHLSAAVSKDLRLTGTRKVRVDHAIDVLWKHLRTAHFRILLEIRAATMSDATLAALTGMALQYFTLATRGRRRADSYAADFVDQLKESIHVLQERSADA